MGAEVNPVATTRRLGEILGDAHLVSAHVIEREICSQARSFLPRRLGEVLVESGAIDRRSLVDALAVQAYRGTVEVLSEPVDPVYLWKVPKELASSLRAIVLAGPRIAMADPLDARAIAMMRRLVGYDSAEVVAAHDRDIAEAIERHYDTGGVNSRRLDGVDPAERPPQLSPTGADLDTLTMLSRLRVGSEEAVPASLRRMWKASPTEPGHTRRSRRCTITPRSAAARRLASPCSSRTSAMASAAFGAATTPRTVRPSRAASIASVPRPGPRPTGRGGLCRAPRGRARPRRAGSGRR